MEAEDRSFTTGSPVEARTREDREKDLLDDEVPDPSARPAGPAGATMTGDELALREELVAAMRDVPFPCDRNALIRHLGEADRRSDLVTRLRVLSADHVYDDVAGVLQGLAGIAGT